MKAAILGVDAGGTHTRALVRAGDGRTGTGQAGPANWTTLGPERCAEAVAEAAGAALHSVGLPAHALIQACVSLAGYYPPWHEAAARAALGAALPVPALRLVPDLMAAWAGATGGEAGIVLAVGTGAVAYGRDAAGRAARAGGWGPLFGDEGGGYWVGCEALRAVSRAHDGRGPETTLRGAVGTEPEAAEIVAESGAAVEESLRAVYREGWSREQVAALCPAVASHAAAGDTVGAEILERAAAQLGALIAAVARRLSWGSAPLHISAVGGVMEAGPPLRGPLERWLAAVLPHAQWKVPLGSPLEGAMLLAGEAGLLCQTS